MDGSGLSLALNGKELLRLPVPFAAAIVVLLCCIAATAYLFSLATFSKRHLVTRYPATEWPKQLAEGKNPRKRYPKYDTSTKEKATESFLKVCDYLVEEAVAELPGSFEMPPKEVAWVRRMLDYNVKGGKMNRGLMVVGSGELLLQHHGEEPDSDTLTKLAVLGWCIEWLQAWLLVADDIMDDSQTRRGQPCWYKNEDVGKIGINDAFMIEMFVYRTLKRHFWQEPYYHQLVDLFMETTFQTECGQLLDLLCTNITLEDFTEDRWTLIVKYKTAFYSFYCSVALGMLVSGIVRKEAFDVAREPLLKMGIYFQAQDDFLDAFGTPEQIGKIGTDIQDKKCGWLFVKAFNKLASPEQKKYLEKHYGNCKIDSVEEKEIKKMYKDLKLEKLYEDYEQQSYDEIMAMKPMVEAAGLPWAVFDMFLKKVYKRQK